MDEEKSAPLSQENIAMLSVTPTAYVGQQLAHVLHGVVVPQYHVELVHVVIERVLVVVIQEGDLQYLYEQTAPSAPDQQPTPRRAHQIVVDAFGHVFVPQRVAENKNVTPELNELGPILVELTQHHFVLGKGVDITRMAKMCRDAVIAKHEMVRDDVHAIPVGERADCRVNQIAQTS